MSFSRGSILFSKCPSECLCVLSISLGSLLLVSHGYTIKEDHSLVQVHSTWEAQGFMPGKALALLLLSANPVSSSRSVGCRRGLAVSNPVPRVGLRHTDSVMIFESYESQVAKQLEAQGRKNVKVERSKITADGEEAFWKIGTGGSSANVDLLQYEAEGLARMADASNGTLAIPRPWLVGNLEGLGGGSSGFIVMDMLKASRSNAQTQRQLGFGLAALHSAPTPDDWEPDLFGFPLDGCCGAFSQPNNAQRKKMNWIDFWVEFRLKHQLRGIRDNDAQRMGDEIIEKISKLFPFPIEEIQPSLLHGDLWGGNHGVDGKTGLPSIYDPACYYGHDEADFGIAHMFGGLSDAFYKAYFSVRPKKEGFEQRALLYELHHHLNHYNIFGGGYLQGAKSIMRRLLDEMEVM